MIIWSFELVDLLEFHRPIGFYFIFFLWQQLVYIPLSYSSLRFCIITSVLPFLSSQVCFCTFSEHLFMWLISVFSSSTFTLLSSLYYYYYCFQFSYLIQSYTKSFTKDLRQKEVIFKVIEHWEVFWICEWSSWAQSFVSQSEKFTGIFLWAYICS